MDTKWIKQAVAEYAPMVAKRQAAFFHLSDGRTLCIIRTASGCRWGMCRLHHRDMHHKQLGNSLAYLRAKFGRGGGATIHELGDILLHLPSDELDRVDAVIARMHSEEFVHEC